jgi:hypothetical protein
MKRKSIAEARRIAEARGEKEIPNPFSATSASSFLGPAEKPFEVLV